MLLPSSRKVGSGRQSGAEVSQVWAVVWVRLCAWAPGWRLLAIGGEPGVSPRLLSLVGPECWFLCLQHTLSKPHSFPHSAGLPSHLPLAFWLSYAYLQVEKYFV